MSSKNIPFALRSRYREILPATVANLSAGNARIPPPHERKKKNILDGSYLLKKWIGLFSYLQMMAVLVDLGPFAVVLKYDTQSNWLMFLSISVVGLRGTIQLSGGFYQKQ